MSLNLLIKIALIALSLFIAYKNKDIPEVQDVKTNNYTKAMLLIWLVPTLVLIGYVGFKTKEWNTLLNFVILLPMAIELLAIDIRNNEADYTILNLIFPFVALAARFTDSEIYSIPVLVSFVIIYIVVSLLTRMKIVKLLLGYGDHASLSALLISYSIIFMKVGITPQATDYQFPIILALISIFPVVLIMAIRGVQRLLIKHNHYDRHRSYFMARKAPMSLAMFVSAVGLFAYNTGVFC